MRERVDMGDVVVDVTAIIVSYNTKDLLAECLHSVWEQTGDLLAEVIVVDNASTDGSCEMVKERFPKVHLISNKENVGFAKANNMAIQTSSGRYILLLNSDAVVIDDSVQRMVQFLDENPQIGACGCKLLFPDGRYQRSAWPLPKILSGIYGYSNLFDRIALFPRLLAPDWFDYPERTRAVGYCTAACLLVSRRCIEEVGLMDENFFLYSEEVDWCKRMWESKWQVFYLAEAKVVHYNGGSQRGYLRRKTRMISAELQYMRKWHGRIYSRAYQTVVWICILYNYLKLLGSQQHSRHADSLLLERRAFYRAVLRGRLDLKS